MDKVLTALKGIFEDARKASNSPLEGVKRVYIGDPLTIQENVLPAIVIHPVRTQFVRRGTKYDQKVHSVDVKLVYNAKDYFGDEDSGEKINISSAIYAGGEITFTTSADHGYLVGDGVFVTGSDPVAYNGTYEVTDILSSTQFKVAKSSDPGAYVDSAIVQIGKTNSVFAVVDAVSKAEKTNDNRETVDNTICGLLEKNPKLERSGVVTSETLNLGDVNYAFNGTDRPFPSFEVILPVDVAVIANR